MSDPGADDVTAVLRVRLPAFGGFETTPSSVVDEVGAWVASKPLEALAGAFGGEPPALLSTGDRLRWFDEFAAAHWDFRNGSERELGGITPLDDKTVDAVRRVGRALGMIDVVRPTRSTYDHVLVLGGLARSCVVRTRYAAALISRELRAGSVAALTAHRSLTDDERALLRDIGASPETDEADVLQNELESSFSLGAPTKHWEKDGATRFARASVIQWERAEMSASLIVAPSSVPSVRRADTADGLAFWVERTRRLTPSTSVLLVTSPIYVPYQHAVAARLIALAHGCWVETVGADFADPNLGLLQHSYSEQSILQEIRSAVAAARQLYSDAQRRIRRVS